MTSSLEPIPLDQKLRKRSLTIAGHRTSLSIEEPFWQALKEIAAGQGVSLAALITRIDRERSGNLSSALRVFVLAHYRAQAPNSGSLAPGDSGADQDPERA